MRRVLVKFSWMTVVLRIYEVYRNVYLVRFKWVVWSSWDISRILSVKLLGIYLIITNSILGYIDLDDLMLAVIQFGVQLFFQDHYWLIHYLTQLYVRKWFGWWLQNQVNTGLYESRSNFISWLISYMWPKSWFEMSTPIFG